MSEDPSGFDASSNSPENEVLQDEALQMKKRLGVNMEENVVKGEPAEEDVPYFTLQYFPASKDHCIEWARDQFNDKFCLKPTLFNQFWTTHTAQEAIDLLKNGADLKNAVTVSKMTSHLPVSVESCVAAARLAFEKYFSQSAKQLLHDFPLDHKMQDGSRFWQPPKRPPHPIEFNPRCKLHVDFVRTVSQLYADVNFIPWTDEDFTDERIRHALKNITLPGFTPKAKDIDRYTLRNKPGREPLSCEELKLLGSRLEERMREASSGPSMLKPHLMEKNNSTDDCIDFIIAASELRAEMYEISTEDELKKTTDDATPSSSAARFATIELMNIGTCSSSEQKSDPNVSTSSPSKESTGQSDEMSDTTKHDFVAASTTSACDGGSKDPGPLLPKMSMGGSIHADYGLNKRQRQENMVRYVVNTMLPTSIASLYDIKKRAEEAEKLCKTSSKQMPISQTGFSARDLTLELKHFHLKSVRLSGDGNEISNGGKYSTTQDDIDQVHDRFTKLKLEWERLSRENRAINSGNEAEYEHNRVNYLDEVELIIEDAMFKEFEPKRETREYKPLKDTSELASAVIYEVHEMNQLIVHLRSWLNDASNSDVATSDTELKMREKGLGMLDEIQVLCDKSLKDKDMFDKTRVKVVLKCIESEPSIKRLSPLKSFDNFYVLLWQGKVPELIASCEKLYNFLLNCAEVEIN